MRKVKQLLFILCWTLFPWTVFAQNVIDPGYFNRLTDSFSQALSFIPTVLFAVGVLILFYGLFKMVTASGSEEARKTGRRTAIYAVVGLVIIVSIYAIISIFQAVFGIGSGSAPPYPQIPPVWYGSA